MEQVIMRLKERDRHLFEENVRSLRTGQESKAKILSNELSQIRNLLRQVISAKLALEHIAMRINTITDLGDIVTTLTPAVTAIKNIHGDLTTVVPQAEDSFMEISSLLNTILVDAGQSGGFKLDFKTASLDAERIVEEATKIAEEELKAKFPELPTTLSTYHTKEREYA